MQISTEALKNTDGILVTIDSENLDAGNTREFREMMIPYLEANMMVIINMEKLKFVDSSGLGSMLSCLRKMNDKHGQLKLIGLTKPILALFELVRMHRIFAIYNTLDEALSSI